VVQTKFLAKGEKGYLRLGKVRLYNTILRDVAMIKVIQFNPLPPSDAKSATEKFILEDFFSAALSQFKKYHSSET